MNRNAGEAEHSDTEALHDAWCISIWTPSGLRLADQISSRRTLAFTGGGDGDVRIKDLGAATVFARCTDLGATLYLHDPGGVEERLDLLPGQARELAGLFWLLCRRDGLPAPRGDHEGEEQDVMAVGAAKASPPPLLDQIAAVVAKPMADTVAMRQALAECLRVLVEGAPATSGMLVLAGDEASFSLVASHGLSPKDAQRLWEKMPHALAEEVLRNQARTLLPEELRRSVGGATTIFVRGVRSVAGFPVVAEDRLVAVFYLGFDNLLKRLSPRLQQTLELAANLLGLIIQRARQREQLERLRLRAAATPALDGMPPGRLMVGASAKLLDVYKVVARLAPVDVTTLVHGETGTGKELVAKELHRLSTRGKGPFVVVNAAALPESLIESELFGHRRGAFTGALTDRAGLVEQAQGGTLFVDEIGELPLPLQAKLLRVLQERSVTRLGDGAPRQVDFRLISATHRDLPAMVAHGEFREDLYYRIAGAVVQLPALRERAEDISILAMHFGRLFAERHGLANKEWSPQALLALERHAWPGNVRELENVVGRAYVMSEGPIIRGNDLGLPGVLHNDTLEAVMDEQVEPTLEKARDLWMKNFLGLALRRHQGRRTDTAKALGIGERTLFRYIEQFGIEEL